MKTYKLLIIVIFFVIIIIPVAFINTKPNQISKIDNKKLPEITQVKDIDTFKVYFSWRIGLREELINLYTEINDKLFNEMVHPIYTYGKDGNVFFKLSEEKHDDEYLNTYAQLVKNIQTYVEDRGSYFLFVINPAKMGCYTELLPDGYYFKNYRINYLENKLDELGVNYIDNTEYLKEISKTKQVYNVKYDVGHWNARGAFYGINQIYAKLKEDGFNIELLDENEYKIITQYKNTLPTSKFAISENVPLYTLKNEAYHFTKKYNESINISSKHTYYAETINNNINNDYRLLFFRGSYLNNNEQFIANRFKQTMMVHNYDNAINIDYYYNIIKPDIVMLDAVEYAIGESYYSSNEIKNKIYNPAYKSYTMLNEDNWCKIDINKIQNEIINSKGSLTKIAIPKLNFKYAYLQAGEDIFDFYYAGKNAIITLDTDTIKNKQVKLILIDENEERKQISIVT